MTRSYLRSNVSAMAGYVPGEQPPVGAKVVKLNTNENPYPPSPKALEAVARSAADGLRLYPDPTARALREAASKAFGFPLEWVVAGNGSDEILAMLVRACASEGETVAYPVPTYSLYRTLVRAHGGIPREVPWAEGHSIPQGLVGEGGGRARLVFLCRPNAPTGSMVPIEAVRELAHALAAEEGEGVPAREGVVAHEGVAAREGITARGGVLCVDEAYVDFADDENDNCLAVVRELENVVVLRTLSKSFSLAGARVGIAFADPALAEGLVKVKDSYNLSRMALAAGEAALSDLDWMRENARHIRETRTRLAGGLAALGFDVLPSQANFVFARIGHPRARELYEALKAKGVLVRYFDQEGVRDGLRVTVGTDAEVDVLLASLEGLMG